RLRERQCALLRAVTADDDQPLDALMGQSLYSLMDSFRRLELWAAGAAQHRSSQLDDPTDIPRVQGNEISLDQSGESPADAEDVRAALDGCAGRGPNGGVHAGRIAAARQHRYSFHLFFLSDRSTGRSEGFCSSQVFSRFNRTSR